MRSFSSMSTNRTACPASVLSARTARNVMAFALELASEETKSMSGIPGGSNGAAQGWLRGMPRMPGKEKPLLIEKEKPPRVLTALKGPDGLLRCPWPGADPLYLAYHDEEWGTPEYDDRALFEKLVLDGFQAGLSWITILRKRPAFRSAFDGFEPERIVRWDAAKKEALMLDPGIVRNRAKIEATVALARIYLDLAERQGFARHLWSFVD